MKHVRQMMVERFKCADGEIRVARAKYVSKEGKGKYGCPIAKYVSLPSLICVGDFG